MAKNRDGAVVFNADKTLELGHHILKGQLYKSIIENANLRSSSSAGSTSSSSSSSNQEALFRQEDLRCVKYGLSLESRVLSLFLYFLGVCG